MLSKLRGMIAGKAQSIDAFVSATMTRSDQQRHVGSTDIEAIEYAASNVAWVDLCSTRIAEDAAAVPLRLYKPASGGERVSLSRQKWLREGVVPFSSKVGNIAEAAGDMVEVTNHPFLDLLEMPNPYQGQAAFRQLRHKFEGLVGDSFVVAGNSSGELLETRGQGRNIAFLHLLLSQWVTPFASDSEMVRGYHYGRDRSSIITLDEREVWASKWQSDPLNPMRGRPPWAGFKAEHDVYLSLIQYMQAMLDNEARPGMVINVEGTIGREEKEAIERKYESRYAGVQHAGRVLFIGNSKANVEVLQHPPRDLGHETINENRIRAILASFKIPEAEVFLNDSNLASSVTGQRQYMLRTIGPRVGAEAEFWTGVLWDAFPETEGWCVAPDQSFVPEDVAANTTRLVSLASAGQITTNELRQELGYDPTEGGDVFRFNGISVDALDEQAKMPAGGGFGFGLQGPGMPMIGGGESEAEKPAQDVAKASLNGAQIEALLSIVDRVSEGSIDKESAIRIALAAFPGMPPAEIRDTFENLYSSVQSPPLEAGKVGDVTVDGDGEEWTTVSIISEKPAEKSHGPDCPCCGDKVKGETMAGLWAKAYPDPPSEATIEAADERRKSASPEDRSPFREELPETLEIYRKVRRAQAEAARDILRRMDESPFGLKSAAAAKAIVSGQLLERMLSQWLGGGLVSQRVLASGVGADFLELCKFGLDTGVSQLAEIGAELDEEIPVIDRPEVRQQFTDLEERFAARMTSVDASATEDIRQHLIAGLDESETIDELKMRVSSVIDNDAKASMIARTETAYAQIEGRKAAFSSHPNVAGKRFMMAPKACPLCVEMNRNYGEKTIPMSQPMIPAGGTITGADGSTITNDLPMDLDVPVHPNCRCDIRIVMRGAE
jgi:hypothetical protein